MSEQAREYQDDEIDLFELVTTIFSGIWTIVSCTVITVSLGVAYYFYAPDNYKGDILLQKPTNIMMSEFTILNENAKNLKFDSLAKNLQLVEAKTLLQNVIAEFRDSEEIAAMIQKHSKKYQTFKGTEKQKADLLAGLLKHFKIAGPDKKTNAYTISIAWDNEQEALNILNESLDLVFENVNAQNLLRLQSYLGALQDRIDGQRARVKAKLAVVKQVIDLKLQQELLFLEEQGSIARELEIAEIAFVSHDMGNMNAVSVSMQSSFPFYLRGYKAIEKERSALLKRSDDHKYIRSDEYFELRETLASLENNVPYTQFQTAVETSPFATKSFALQVDTNLIDFKNSKKLMLILVLSGLLGGILGVLIVVVRSGYKNHTLRAQGE